jgi:hypothetical protein
MTFWKLLWWNNNWANTNNYAFCITHSITERRMRCHNWCPLMLGKDYTLLWLASLAKFQLVPAWFQWWNGPNFNVVSTFLLTWISHGYILWVIYIPEQLRFWKNKKKSSYDLLWYSHILQCIQFWWVKKVSSDYIISIYIFTCFILFALVALNKIVVLYPRELFRFFHSHHYSNALLNVILKSLKHF